LHVPLLASFSISDSQWQKIEEECGLKIPRDLRRAVAASTQIMRNRSDIRQSALPIRKVLKQITGTRRTAIDWLKSMEGLHPDVEALIMSLEKSDQAEDFIKPFVKGIVVSCDERLAYAASMKDARDPWKNWIVEITRLFKQNDLPFAARKDVDKNKTGRPSPFVIFIWELQQLIEPKYRQHDHSVEALADAISRAQHPRTGKASKPVRPRRRRATRPLSGRKRKTPLPNKPRR
jgi:hypothetical protein